MKTQYFLLTVSTKVIFGIPVELRLTLVSLKRKSSNGGYANGVRGSFVWSNTRTKWTWIKEAQLQLGLTAKKIRFRKQKWKCLCSTPIPTCSLPRREPLPRMGPWWAGHRPRDPSPRTRSPAFGGSSPSRAPPHTTARPWPCHTPSATQTSVRSSRSAKRAGNSNASNRFPAGRGWSTGTSTNSSGNRWSDGDPRGVTWCGGWIGSKSRGWGEETHEKEKKTSTSDNPEFRSWAFFVRSCVFLR